MKTYKYTLLFIFIGLILFRIQIGYENKIEELKKEVENKSLENAFLKNSIYYMTNIKKKLHSKPIYGWPVAIEDYKNLTSPFGYRILLNPFTGGSRNSFHGGIDIAGTYHARVLAVADGIVQDVYLIPGWHAGKYFKGHPILGGMIKIKHIDGTYSVYGHLSAIYVSEYGKKRIVKKGQLIGRMGDTGESIGQHLHFELRNKEDQAIQPLFYLKDPTNY